MLGKHEGSCTIGFIVPMDLGFEGSVFLQTPQRTGQGDHGGRAFKELVETRHDAVILF